MLDNPFDFAAIVIAIVAFIFARKAMNQAAALRTRLDLMQQLAADRPVPPPLTRVQATEPAMTPAASSAAPVPPVIPDVESIAPAATPAPKISDTPPAAPPPLPQPDRGFEETVGTRWVVWIGGLTLALGGFFMVRYSIDAGLLGPGVRTILGGLFALALLAAGEWTRRKESISAIEALPVANIPAILTAAGTAVACPGAGGQVEVQQPGPAVRTEQDEVFFLSRTDNLAGVHVNGNSVHDAPLAVLFDKFVRREQDDDV